MAGWTVLVVDDSEMDRFFADRVLRKLPRVDAVHFSRDGAEALAWLREHGPPDLMFVDINMPRMDGFELIKAIAAQFEDWPEHCRVAILSSSDWRGDRERAGELGLVDAYFVKPLTRDAMESWLEPLA